jgi:hypothetical protein
MFQAKQHVLNWPIKGADNKDIKTISIKPITMGEHRAISKQHKDNDRELLRACIVIGTGLTLADLKQMITPDFNSLKSQVMEYLHTPAKIYIDEQHEITLLRLNEKYQTLVSEKAPQKRIDSVTKNIECCSFDVNRPELLIPITGDDGKAITSYKLRPPTVHITDLMDTYEDEWIRTIFISSSCSDLSEKELESLSLPDWNQLQERLIDFLGKSADYFRQKT